MKHAAALSFVLTALFSGGAWSANLNMREGLWELTDFRGRAHLYREA